MNRNDLTVGKWYYVRVDDPSTHPPAKYLRLGRLDSLDQSGWHSFSVIHKNDGNFLTDKIHSKSVIRPGGNPVPVKGTPEYKAWIEKGIAEAKAKQDAIDRKEFLSMAADLLGGLEDTSTMCYGDAFQVKVSSKAAAERVLQIIRAGIKNKLFDSYIPT